MGGHLVIVNHYPPGYNICLKITFQGDYAILSIYLLDSGPGELASIKDIFCVNQLKNARKLLKFQVSTSFAKYTFLQETTYLYFIYLSL